MRLLDRFLLRELAIPLAYCLAGCLIFWISFNLLHDIDDFQQDHLLAIDIIEIYWVRLPDLLVIVLPVGFLLALLYSLANHSRHHELTAMRSAGISLWRICMPYLAVGFALSASMFWISEKLAPTSEDRERRIRAHRLPDGSDEQWIQGLNFRNARDNRIWTIRAYNPDRFEMSQPQVDWRLRDGSRRTLIARTAIRTNNFWQFSNVQFFAYPPGRAEVDTIAVRTNVMVMPEFTETPADIRVLIKFSRINAVSASKRAHLSLSEIDYIKNHLELNARDRAMLDTQRHARLAQPWTCLIVALIAIPFGAASGRRNVFIGVAASIFICLAYLVLQPLGLALANGQFIPSAVGAWLPNALFGATGIWLTNRVK